MEVDASGLQYRVRFKDITASDDFAALANLWAHSRVSGEYNEKLRILVLFWARDSWDPESEEAALSEIEITTNSLALFDGIMVPL